ncbi:MAG: hypothetical protein IPM13_01755 [Phycisphaerales bacterium]|nr:hypothetical protein [Phycisphaerales bacterium]
MNTTAGRIRLEPTHAFRPATGETFAFWVETNSLQSQWGVYGQKISAAGARQWGDTGLEITALDGNQESFVRATPFLDGAMAFWFESSGNSRILGTRVDSGGAAAWVPAVRTVSNRITEKSRLDVNRTPSGMALLAWGDGPATGNRDIYATNVNPPNGSVGLPVFLHGDTDCDGDIDFDDIDPFVAALGGQAVYEVLYPGCYWLNADADGDGDVDFDDIDAFVALIGS